jgi:hypothetical protein
MKGKTIVILQASSAIRYVSHPMWEPQRLEGAAALLGALAQTSGSSDDRLFEIMI